MILRIVNVSIFLKFYTDHIIISFFIVAGCVLHMFLHAITENNFKNALNYYLIANEFKAAIPDDLSNAFQNISHPTIPENVNFKIILDSWHMQSGFPSITVNYNRGTAEITLEQSRFLTNPDSNSPDDSIWWIPFNIIFEQEINEPQIYDTQAEFWLHEKQQLFVPTANRNWSQNNGFILLNKAQTGYYRVNYDDESWKKLIVFLKTSDNFMKFPLLSRSNLIEDAAELVKVGLLKYEIYLSLLEYLPMSEIDAIPWLTASTKIKELMDKFYGTPAHLNMMVLI